MSKLSIGEKIELLIRKRVDCLHGQYLGSTGQTFGACKVNGVIYKVKRNIEVTAEYFWEVFNVNTGQTTQLKDQYDLPYFEG